MTRNPKPQIPNPKSQTRKSEPQTRNPKSQNPNLKTAVQGAAHRRAQGARVQGHLAHTARVQENLAHTSLVPKTRAPKQPCDFLVLTCYFWGYGSRTSRALPTETKVESGTSQSKSGISINFSNSENPKTAVPGAAHRRAKGTGSPGQGREDAVQSTC